MVRGTIRVVVGHRRCFGLHTLHRDGRSIRGHVDSKGTAAKEKPKASEGVDGADEHGCESTLR